MSQRLVQRGESERPFDREFWSQLTPEQRGECLWDMVLEARELKGLPYEDRRCR